MWEMIKRLMWFLILPVMVVGGTGIPQHSVVAHSHPVSKAQTSGNPPTLNFPIHAPWPAGVVWHAGDDGSFFVDDCDPANGLYHCDDDQYAIDFNGSGANGETVDDGVIVMSVADGLVNSAGWVNGYGYSVVINHGSSYQSRYAHLTNRPLVEEGDWIPQGTPLGYVGSTGGTSTGNHLHFVMYYCDPTDIQLAPNSNRVLCGDNNSEIQALRPLPLEGDSDLTDGEQVASGNYGVGFEVIADSDLTNANAIRIHRSINETYGTLGGEFVFGLTNSAVQRWQGTGNFYQEFGPSSHQNVPWEGLRSALIEKDNIAYFILDPIWNDYKQQGGPNSRLGLPVSHTYDQYVTAPNGGQIYQLRTDFEHGSIIGRPPNVTEIYDSQNVTWRGRLYEDSNFQRLNLERYDKYIDFQWVPEQSNDRLGLRSHLGGSAIWEGRVGGTISLYRLNIKLQGHVQIYVDGDEVLNEDSPDQEQEFTSTQFGLGEESVQIRFRQDAGKTARIQVTSRDLLQIVQPVEAYVSRGTIIEDPPVLSDTQYLLYEAPPFPGSIAPVPQPGITPLPFGQGRTATALVMDVSGSMGDAWQGGIKIESARSAAHQILNMLSQESQVGGGHRVGVASFSSDATLLQDLTTDISQVRVVIDSLYPQDRTNLGAGVETGNAILTQSAPDESKILILLSDGMSNTGIDRSQILAGPVQNAVQAGTCLYTVGFGDPGNLDEDLLRQIAAASQSALGCGQYYYATDVIDLESTYIRIRHQSTGNILAEFDGYVAQGQTVQAGSVDVPPGQAEMAISLHWPGSKMDLVLHDPAGNTIQPGDPNLRLTTYGNLVYALVLQPLPGAWLVDVVGIEIPTPVEAYQVLVSARAAPVTPTPVATPTPTPPPVKLPEPRSSGFETALLLLLLGGGGVALYVYATVLRRKRGTTRALAGSLRPASLLVVSGPLSGREFPVTGDSVSIGRGAANQVVLPDQAVSRLHVTLRYGQGEWFAQDQNSRSGTYVNGQRVSATRLSNGDRILVGGTEMIFKLKS